MTDHIAAARALLDEMNRPGFFTRNGYHFPCRELRDMVATLADALDAEREKSKSLGQEINRARYGEPDFAWSLHRSAFSQEQARAERAEAERDQALARLAAAYEAADDVLGKHCFHEGHWARRDIRALTPSAAEAALQRVVDAAWNEAVEASARAQEAAYVRGVFGEKHPDHIRALKRPEAQP